MIDLIDRSAPGECVAPESVISSALDHCSRRCDFWAPGLLFAFGVKYQIPLRLRARFPLKFPIKFLGYMLPDGRAQMQGCSSELFANPLQSSSELAPRYSCISTKLTEFIIFFQNFHSIRFHSILWTSDLFCLTHQFLLSIMTLHELRGKSVRLG